jgi:putative transposase
MDVQRTLTIGLPEDADLRATLEAFQQVLQALSPIAFNQGQPLPALALQRVAYHRVKGTVNAQMTISAIRRVAGAYQSAQRNRRPAKRPFRFHRRAALFLIGKRGRDADFRRDGTLSVWTVAGRKRLAYTVPAVFQDRLREAVEIDSVTVVERQGRLLGRVVVTLRVPDPQGTVPIGVDLNETNAVVAVDADGRELFISVKAIKVKNRRTSKTYERLQRKLATRKAEH